jgi:acyl dehydratase
MPRISRFEDYRAGQSGSTSTITVTEAHIVAFAAITGDYTFGHMDRHAMQRSPFGERVAHGLLGSGLAVGMLSHWAPHVVGRDTAAARLVRLKCNYKQPLRLGDTIRIDWRVEHASDAEQRRVESRFDLVDQGGEPLYDGTVAILFEPAEAAPKAPWSVVESDPDPSRMYYVEDLEPGHGGETHGRTMTEADVVNYAGLVGDLDPRYVDAEAALRAVSGVRLVPPMLVFSVVFALWHREWSRYRSPDLGLAGHLSDGVEFCAPVRIGDTIRARYKVLSTRLSRSRPGVGLELWGLQALNQRDEVVQEGSMLMMRPSAAGRGAHG